MFNGNEEVQRAATQQLMECAIHLRRASDALMSVQAMTSGDEKQKATTDRARLDTLAASYDAWFQRVAPGVFG